MLSYPSCKVGCIPTHTPIQDSLSHIKFFLIHHLQSTSVKIYDYISLLKGLLISISYIYYLRLILTSLTHHRLGMNFFVEVSIRLYFLLFFFILRFLNYEFRLIAFLKTMLNFFFVLAFHYKMPQ